VFKRKELLEDVDIVMSLLHLSNELWEGRKDLSSRETMLAFKINSCLYAGYPSKLEGRPTYIGET
jgi:hypothetical protein